MKLDAESLGSWSVEIDVADRSSLILVLNGRSLKLPCEVAEILARALRARCCELATKGNIGPANIP